MIAKSKQGRTDAANCSRNRERNRDENEDVNKKERVIRASESESESSDSGSLEGMQGEEPDKPVLTISVDECFSEFWAAYWRKDARIAAQKIYRRKVRTMGDHAEIMQGVIAQREYYLGREVQHRPHGATWLNQERWKDDPTQLVNTSNSTFHKLAGVQVVRDARVEAIRQRMDL